MKVSGISARAWRWGAGVAAGAMAAGVLALSGCGGGTPIDPFRPTRIIAFGDEYSVINTDTAKGQAGAKYTVNAFAVAASGATSTTIDCTLNASWVQSVAGAFGLAFKACPGGVSNPNGLDFAQAGAKVADVATQIASFQASGDGPFKDSDIVTVMAGQNDVLAAYDQYPATPEDALVQQLTDRGKSLAQQVNNIALAGPAVIVVRIPDLGLTPYAVKQNNLNAGRAALLSRLSMAYNTALQLNLINDGHLIGLVFGDSETQNMVNFSIARNPNSASYPYSNVTDPVCASAAAATSTGRDDASLLLTCTTSTLVGDATASTYGNYLWAGNIMLGPLGQSTIGTSAASRAISNPF